MSALSVVLVAVALAAPSRSEPWVAMDSETVGIDLLTPMCRPQARGCAHTHQAVLRSAGWAGPVALLLDGRLERTGEAGAVALAGGWGHRGRRADLELGAMADLRLGAAVSGAAGPRLAATLHPVEPEVRPRGVVGDLRNSELALELRPVWPLVPGAARELFGRSAWTAGSERVRAGLAAEVWVRGARPEASVGLRVEVRPTPRPSAPAR